MRIANQDWFEPALYGNGSWTSGLDRVLCIEESKLQFVRCLKSILCNTIPHAPDRITILQQDVKMLEHTLQLRLGILAMDRPQAWFRHSPATERGPFSAAVFEDPIFSRFEESRAVAIRHVLPELWRSRQVSCSEYDPSASLWGRLLLLNKRWAQLNQLPPPFGDVFVDELPEALPDDLSSPALIQFGALLAQKIKACQRDLEVCYQQLWCRSESFLYALHIQHLSHKARKQQSHQQSSQSRHESRPRSPFSQAVEESLRFMNFGSMPSFTDLKQRYRTMAHHLHPDKGGNEERFKLLTYHYQQLLKFLQRA
jgi:hypothetical protein